jgi:hypothetical protein
LGGGASRNRTDERLNASKHRSALKGEFPRFGIRSVSATIGVHWSIFDMRIGETSLAQLPEIPSTVRASPGEGASRSGLGTRQQIECGDVRDHQHEHINGVGADEPARCGAMNIL